MPYVLTTVIGTTLVKEKQKIARMEKLHGKEFPFTDYTRMRIAAEAISACPGVTRVHVTRVVENAEGVWRNGKRSD